MPWYLKLFGKQRLIEILWSIARRVLGKLYRSAVELVKEAEKIPSLDTGYKKAEWVAMRLARQYDEGKEWKWLWNLVVELAVGEVKGKMKKLTTLKLPGWLR